MTTHQTLFFRNPQEVYRALVEDRCVHEWLEQISNHYTPPISDIYLFYPCTSTKPFSNSQTYRQLTKTLQRLGPQRKRIHILTVSEPFGIIPLEMELQVPAYDCPGLFRWWCARHSEQFEVEYLDRSIEVIASYTARFLKRLPNKPKVAVVRTYSSSLERRCDHTHRRILERAAEISGISIELLPTKAMVKKIVQTRGRYAWDRYGPAHPLVQQYLLNKLSVMLNGS